MYTWSTTALKAPGVGSQRGFPCSHTTAPSPIRLRHPQASAVHWAQARRMYAVPCYFATTVKQLRYRDAIVPFHLSRTIFPAACIAFAAPKLRWMNASLQNHPSVNRSTMPFIFIDFCRSAVGRVKLASWCVAESVKRPSSHMDDGARLPAPLRLETRRLAAGTGWCLSFHTRH